MDIIIILLSLVTSVYTTLCMLFTVTIFVAKYTGIQEAIETMHVYVLLHDDVLLMTVHEL